MNLKLAVQWDEPDILYATERCLVDFARCHTGGGRSIVLRGRHAERQLNGNATVGRSGLRVVTVTGCAALPTTECQTGYRARTYIIYIAMLQIFYYLI